MYTQLFKLSLLSSMIIFSTYSYAQDAATTTNRTQQTTTTTSANVPIKTDTSAVPSPQEDQLITKNIKSWISKSKALSKLNVEVQTNQGIVTLNGAVDSDSQAEALVELAMSIIGVRDVNTSNLTVKGSEQPLADTWITAKAKGILIREKIFGDRDVAPMKVVVETKNGVVYLTGTVENQQQVDNAIALIKTIQGVNRVEYKFSKLLPQANAPHSDSDVMTRDGTNNTNGNNSMNNNNMNNSNMNNMNNTTQTPTDTNATPDRTNANDTSNLD